MIDFSVVVPTWRGAIRYLPRLFDSIPVNEGIEIIVVDNSKEPVRREEIKSTRDIKLLHSSPDRHAGGSRNDGMAAANGKWLLFADADDYYTPDAFDVYYSMIDTDAEIVYTGMGGIYEDTGEPSDRGDIYKKMVHEYCAGIIDENVLRTKFHSPCCKMVSHDLVNRYNLKFDEIRAANDSFFSISSGVLAKTITAIDVVTYIATVNRGSLTRRRDYEVIKARLYAALHDNVFLKSHGYGRYQMSVMYYLMESRHFGIAKTLEFLRMIIRARQNPFIGWKRWFKTRKNLRRIENKEAKYITKN